MSAYGTASAMPDPDEPMPTSEELFAELDALLLAPHAVEPAGGTPRRGVSRFFEGVQWYRAAKWLGGAA